MHNDGSWRWLKVSKVSSSRRAKCSFRRSAKRCCCLSRCLAWQHRALEDRTLLENKKWTKVLEDRTFLFHLFFCLFHAFSTSSDKFWETHIWSTPSFSQNVTDGSYCSHLFTSFHIVSHLFTSFHIIQHPVGPSVGSRYIQIHPVGPW